MPFHLITVSPHAIESLINCSLQVISSHSIKYLFESSTSPIIVITNSVNFVESNAHYSISLISEFRSEKCVIRGSDLVWLYNLGDPNENLWGPSENLWGLSKNLGGRENIQGKEAKNIRRAIKLSWRWARKYPRGPKKISGWAGAFPPCR